MQHPHPSSVKNIYVGNLNSLVKEADLKALFEKHGAVHSVKLMVDPDGCSRGFGFVEMDNAAALEAILELNKTHFCGKELDLN